MKNAMYRFWLWLFERYEPRFRPKIPERILQLGRPFKLDLNVVRFSRKVLSVNQVDEMLEEAMSRTRSFNSALDRIHLKNLLLTLNLMDAGAFTWDKGDWMGLSPYAYRRPMLTGKLWKHGLSLRYTRFQRWQARGGWLQYRYQTAVILWERAKKYVKDHKKGDKKSKGMTV